ncbi:hypothetical protein A2950_02255 [Candidatus Kaiserbacteria bacterium RIFCSPLOWO2_01_FULL_55_19]|uniref:Cell shape-determining protein MreC n=1 Tax=Candidatus Kaiserbacteria bacterium RIFCSPLOWO2_01_FULL_55_19 TaxID=1798516 RepID=A0A1F6ERJ9_9BACT|nr:MAG: hypothetical protein A2950_02255 [Candidatus Kaiserbacteria bacterium RIFCSPLOWO2_01_FULL_55_19]
MKKIFLAKRNALFSSAGISWGASSLALALALLLLRLLAPNFFLHLVTPVFRSADFVSAQSHSFLSSFRDTAKLALQNERLLEENAALTNENRALAQKETVLTALLGGTSRGITAPEVLASILARPPESPYDTFILAQGSRAGITLGMEVFGAGGTPIGVVSSVLADFSRVTLFSSPGVSIHGWVGRASMPVTIFGSGGGTMSAELGRSANVSVGDTVFVSGPGQLPLGTVVRIESDPSSSVMTLRIMPAFNLFSASWVVVRDTGALLLDGLPHTTSTLP